MMTIDEKARLAFHYLATGQAKLINGLQESIPAKKYVLRDLDFDMILGTSILFAHMWSFEYMKNITEQSTRNAKYFHDVLQGNHVPTEAELSVQLNEFEGRSLAIDAALVEICQRFSLCPDDIRRHTGAEPYQPIRDSAQMNQNYFSELVNLFDAMIKSWPINSIQKSKVGACVH